jgi:hypothetical protein
MMALRSLGLALAAMLAAVGMGASVQAQKAATDPNSFGLTELQRDSLYGRHTFTPGHYAMRPLPNSYCLGVQVSSNPRDVSYFKTVRCFPGWESSGFFFVPHPDGGFTIRAVASSSGNGRFEPGVSGTTLRNCATSARGVVFGPARVDYRLCDRAGSGRAVETGGIDQRFDVRLIEKGVIEIRFYGPEGITNDCWAVRGGNVVADTDLIRWPCNGQPDQRFVVTALKPLVDLEEETFNFSGWYAHAAGHVRLSPTPGVALAGPVTAQFETIADKGDYCMRRCAELSDCKAWSWTAAGFQGQAQPMCYWRSAPGPAVNVGRPYHQTVISGITRF